MMYFPDKSKLLKIDYNGSTVYKLFSTFYGGYAYGDSWKLNSGITKVVKNEVGAFEVYGTSGSVYIVRPDSEGTSSYTQGVLRSLFDPAVMEKSNARVEILPLSDLENLNDVLVDDNGNSSPTPQEPTP